MRLERLRTIFAFFLAVVPTVAPAFDDRFVKVLGAELRSADRAIRAAEGVDDRLGVVDLLRRVRTRGELADDLRVDLQTGCLRGVHHPIRGRVAGGGGVWAAPPPRA